MDSILDCHNRQPFLIVFWKFCIKCHQRNNWCHQRNNEGGELCRLTILILLTIIRIQTNRILNQITNR